MSTATAPIIEAIPDATNVASLESLNRTKGFLGTTAEMIAVAETLAPHSVEWVKSLSDAELFPLGEKALHDIADDILILDEIRNRFRAAKGVAILGYQNWREFVEKNSLYSVRTVQRRLAEKNGKDESKVNHRYIQTEAELRDSDDPWRPITQPSVNVLAEPAVCEPSCPFEGLISSLYCLTKSGNDGVEHKFIDMMNAALTRCESAPAVEDGREQVIYLLNRISSEFLTYAERLKKTIPASRTVPLG
jgi:hypothetical protein